MKTVIILSSKNPWKVLEIFLSEVVWTMDMAKGPFESGNFDRLVKMGNMAKICLYPWLHSNKMAKGSLWISLNLHHPFVNFAKLAIFVVCFWTYPFNFFFVHANSKRRFLMVQNNNNNNKKKKKKKKKNIYIAPIQ